MCSGSRLCGPGSPGMDFSFFAAAAIAVVLGPDHQQTAQAVRSLAVHFVCLWERYHILVDCLREFHSVFAVLAGRDLFVNDPLGHSQLPFDLSSDNLIQFTSARLTLFCDMDQPVYAFYNVFRCLFSPYVLYYRC